MRKTAAAIPRDDQVASLRVPPYSIEAEQSVLGGLLLDNSAWDRAGDLLTDSDFYRYEHKAIYAAIGALVNHSKPADVITVFEQLQSHGKAEECGGIAYLNALAQSVPSATNLRRYAEIVRNRATLRQAIAAADKVTTLAFAPGADAEAVMAEARGEFAQLQHNACASAFQRVALTDLGSVEPEPAPWPWAGLVPPDAVSLWCGHGGSGKSTVSLAFGAHVAVGRPYLGHSTTKTPVAFFSAEDPGSLVRGRLSHIVRLFALSAEEVAQHVHILDVTDGDTALYADTLTQGKRVGVTTRTYGALRDYIKRHEIGLVIIDNASDVFDGDEIRRASVRAFMRSIAALVRDRGGAVVLLAHIDKATAKMGSSESYSGSTAWHNSARSRLFLAQKSPGDLELRHEKCNLGPLQEPIRLVWPSGGMPDIERPLSSVVAGIEARNDTKAILRLIDEFTKRGEAVSVATTSRTHAGKLLRGEPTFPRQLKDAELFDLLRRAEREDLVHRVTYKGADRHQRERWEVTEAGASKAGIAATAATSRAHEVPAGGEVPAWEPAATAATSLPGVIGGKRAAGAASAGDSR